MESTHHSHQHAVCLSTDNTNRLRSPLKRNSTEQILRSAQAGIGVITEVLSCNRV
jgi:hypothetical protein